MSVASLSLYSHALSRGVWLVAEMHTYVLTAGIVHLLNINQPTAQQLHTLDVFLLASCCILGSGGACTHFMAVGQAFWTLVILAIQSAVGVVAGIRSAATLTPDRRDYDKSSRSVVLTEDIHRQLAGCAVICHRAAPPRFLQVRSRQSACFSTLCLAAHLC